MGLALVFLFYIRWSVQLIWGVLDKHSLILIAAFLGPLGIPGELTLWPSALKRQGCI